MKIASKSGWIHLECRNLVSLLKKIAMPFGLYIHIPFCQSRCPYCDFAFVVRKTHLAERYTQAVTCEIQTRLKPLVQPVFDTLYLGGGTPSTVPPQLLDNILQAVRLHATLAPDAELTVEANPGDQSHFQALFDLGMNRLSLGVQALTDRALKALGRFHTTKDAITAYQTARKIGFANIGIDLIFGVPEQTRTEWQTILQNAIALGPEHMSIYGLTIEPGTNFGRRFEKGHLPLPVESDQADMYLCAIDQLEAAGYEHYEISNFAQPGFVSRHNRRYWIDQPYIGAGLSAHSYFNGVRSWNIRDLMGYMEAVEKTGMATEGEEQIDSQAHFLEQIMLGLRQRQGVEAFVIETHHTTQSQLQYLLDHQFLERVDNRIRLTRRGLLLADEVCAELVKNS